MASPGTQDLHVLGVVAWKITKKVTVTPGLENFQGLGGYFQNKSRCGLRDYTVNSFTTNLFHNPTTTIMLGPQLHFYPFKILCFTFKFLYLPLLNLRLSHPAEWL
jgi:hypothetical protein